MGRSGRNFLLGCAACIAAAGIGGPAVAERTETVLHIFFSTAGKVPLTGPVIDSSTGALYGITSGGGTSNSGVVYQMLPPTGTGTSWAYSVIYNIPSPTGITNVLAAGGTVYFNSTNGGSGCCGAVFLLTPPVSGT